MNRKRTPEPLKLVKTTVKNLTVKSAVRAGGNVGNTRTCATQSCQTC
jgi:hypothetical protein